MHIGIIGMGLIGGSLAKSLKSRGMARHILGVEANIEHGKQAIGLGLIDEIVPLQTAIETCDLIVLAVPVNAIIEILPEVLDQVTHQTVLDVGSTKSQISLSVEGHPARGRYVACHPMAGTEFSGPQAAVEKLFEGKCNVVCNPEKSDADAVQKVVHLFESIGMYTIYQDAQLHDMHAAYVSHMSHVSSIALALTVLHKEKSEEEIFRLASGGFRSTVRLAKSNPATWIPIFEQNREHLLDVLDEHITVLSKFRSLLIKKDFKTFHQLMEEANSIKNIINTA